jgi:molecular chaperone GrpE
VNEAEPTNEESQTADDVIPETSKVEGEPSSLEEVQGKADVYLANWKRAQADLENYRKKADQAKQELATFANAMLVSGMLSTLDDLERAFDTLDADLAGLTWVEGLKLIYRKLLSTLETQGLSVINAVGEPFDPSIHEAVMQSPGEEGQVVGVLQKGYRFKERVIRPAMVKVGDGSPAEAQDA